MKKRRITKITRKRMSLAHKGEVPWNKGLKGVQVSYRKGRTWNQIWGERKAKKMKQHLREAKWIGATNINREGYLRMKNRKTGKELLYHHHIWMKKHNKNKIPKGCLIHHKDRNILNNSPSNLQLMKFSTHTRLHHLGIKLKRRKK